MTVRVAIIGAGHLGRIHTRLMQQHEAAELVAVVDPVVGSREAIADEFGVSGWSDFSAHLDRFDAAVVATPTEFHHHVVCQLLQAGKDVFVEKPIATTSEQAREMVRLARDQRCILQVGHVERFNPAFSAGQQHVDSPQFISTQRTSGFAFRSADIGVVLDLMIHDLDLTLTWVKSPLIEVRSTGFSILGGHEDVAHAWLRFRSGCVATLFASRVSPENTRTFEAVGHKRSARLDLATGKACLLQPGENWPCPSDAIHAMSVEERKANQSRFFTDFVSAEPVESAETNAILEEQRDFLECVQSRQAPIVPGKQGARVLEVAQRILAAMHLESWTEEGRWRAAA